MMLHHCFSFFLIFFELLYPAVAQSEHLTPILPGDPYSVIGDIEKRQLGRCSYLYAWLAIPQGSHQDIYAHYSACSRLELRFMEAAREVRSPRPDYTVKIGEELNRVNRDYTAQLMDLETLDALLQTVKVTSGAQNSPSLTLKDRIFYLSDRLGQYTMLAMLRPGRLPKIEIIPPPSEKTHIHPQNVLCYRKSCDPDPKDAVLTPATLSANTTADYMIMLAQSKQENRRIYVQLIIYRVVFALAAFLCILFGIASLILCIRLRSRTRLQRKGPRKEGPYNQTPSYNQLNGGYKISTPVYFTDPNMCTVNAAHVPSDTASLHNTAISSNMSGCELLAASAANGNPYGGFAYPTAYSADGSGVLKLIPAGRVSASSGTGQAFYSMPPAAFNRSVSPASEGYRTGSLDRRSEAASEKMRRRTPIQVINLPQGAEIPPTASLIPIARPFSQYPQSSFKSIASPSTDQTLASQASVGTVIHKFPGDVSYHGSINGDSMAACGPMN